MFCVGSLALYPQFDNSEHVLSLLNVNIIFRLETVCLNTAPFCVGAWARSVNTALGAEKWSPKRHIFQIKFYKLNLHCFKYVVTGLIWTNPRAFQCLDNLFQQFKMKNNNNSACDDTYQTLEITCIQLAGKTSLLVSCATFEKSFITLWHPFPPLFFFLSFCFLLFLCTPLLGNLCSLFCWFLNRFFNILLLF